MAMLKKCVMLSVLIAPVLSYASVTGPDKVAARASYQPGRADEVALRSAPPMWRKPTQATHTRIAEAGRVEPDWRDPATKPILWHRPGGR